MEPSALMNCYDFKYSKWEENPDDEERRLDYLEMRREVMKRLILLEEIKKKVEVI